MMRIIIRASTINKETLQQFLQEPYFVPEGTSFDGTIRIFPAKR